MMRQSRFLMWATSGSLGKLACRDEIEVYHAGRPSLTGTADPQTSETIQHG